MPIAPVNLFLIKYDEPGADMNHGWGPLARFNDLSLAHKLYACFALLVVGLVVVVIVGSTGMSSMSAAHNDVVTVGVPTQVAAEQARGAASDMHFSETKYVLEGRAGRSDYLDDRATYGAALRRLVKLSTAAGDKPLISSIETATARFDQGDAHLWALVRAGRRAEAVTVVVGAQNDASDALMAAFSDFQQHSAAGVTRQTHAFDTTASSARLTMILVGAIAVLLGAAAAFLLTRSLAGRARRMMNAADGIATGDVDQETGPTSGDELGATAAAFQRMIEYLQTMVGAARQIAGGDLSVHIEPQSERDALGTAFAEMIANLRRLVGEVAQAAGVVGSASLQMSSTSVEAGRATGEIADAIGAVAQGAERQVSLVATAGQAADEVADAVRRSAEQAEQTAEVAARAREIVTHGVAAADEANQAMGSVRDSSQDVTVAIKELAAKSGQIGAIVQTITGIAEQTNLLALNAAIEAARAGEQGKGFAVVAEEVRKLAEESQHAAHEISDLIGAIQGETTKVVGVVETGARRTEDGAGVVERTREAFLSIGEAVDDMASRVDQIASAAQEISAAAGTMRETIGEVASVAEQSSASTEEVSASTEETSASAEQIAASAQELSGNASVLSQLVSQFKTDE
jgi:methyl-accepting chemotaxis protein